MKKIVVLSLCLVFLLCNVCSAFAKSEKQTRVLKIDGRNVEFNIGSNVKDDISDEELKSLATSNPNTDSITIYEIGYAVSSTTDKKDVTESQLDTNSDKSQVSPNGIGDYLTYPSKKYTHYNVLESDRFMASCARGETKTISSTITEKLSASVDGTIKFGSLNLNNEISYSITRGQTLTGPPEDSSYNTREYRCKFYQNKGTWTQVGMLNGMPLFFSGSFTEPTKYISYSLDSYTN
ncbi:hypothetical protein [Petroclostridium sp. X23]|uniref:hypothetical protein n=1 Tax=Petroclostridium sp. X23 TaxID=3045146 RepID=UPI0024AE6166|nr:hypothetical protein [Petroclostridium sp. X23]WHH57669.1 hypothetical protein QKW49_17810 [Petroclostridium sp. X23]